MHKLVFAQTNASNLNNSGAVIYVAEGTQIYSQDESLNRQLKGATVNISETDVLDDDDNSVRQSQVYGRKTKEKSQKTFASEVRESVENKKDKLSEKIRQELAQYEKRKENFVNEKIENPFSPDYFFSSQITAKNYGVPRVENYNQSKLELSLYSYIVKSALDHLHTQYYNFYNNRSFDQCFSKVFSVRPPPVLA